jgi:endogenous inhibitor of DNA gyrase (YacG/DUF329 family)
MPSRCVKVACPVCRRPVDWNASAFRPFCSDRCRLLDLGKWVDEAYRVPGEPVIVDDGGSTNGFSDDDDLDG